MIQNIVDDAECSACGACVTTCPVSAITMLHNSAGFLQASVDDKKCICCRQCLYVCPAHNKKKRITKDDVVGKIESAYIGYATDKELRSMGQSGGIVSGLLLYLLEKKVVDYVFVCEFDKSKQRYEIVKVSQKKGILSAVGSVYVQTSPLSHLRDVDGEYACVLLGCQADALKRMSNIKKPKIKIGLVCECTNSKYLMDNLIWLSREKREIESFRFRDKRFGGVPGDVCIATNKGNRTLPNGLRRHLFSEWKAYSCYSCYFKLNPDSDLVCMDPWGISNKENENGNTVVLIRNDLGKQIMLDAQKEGYIQFSELSAKECINGQHVDEEYITEKNSILGGTITKSAQKARKLYFYDGKIKKMFWKFSIISILKWCREAVCSFIVRGVRYLKRRIER